MTAIVMEKDHVSQQLKIVHVMRDGLNSMTVHFVSFKPLSDMYLFYHLHIDSYFHYDFSLSLLGIDWRWFLL